RQRACPGDRVFLDLVTAILGEPASELHRGANHALGVLVARHEDVHQILVVDVAALLGDGRDVAGAVRLGLVAVHPHFYVEQRALKPAELPRTEVAFHHPPLGDRRMPAAGKRQKGSGYEQRSHENTSYLVLSLTAEVASLNSPASHGQLPVLVRIRYRR